MRVSAVRNLNLSKAKKLNKLNFSGAKKSNKADAIATQEVKKASYLPKMLTTIGIGLAILWGTARLFKDKTAPISYLWK